MTKLLKYWYWYWVILGCFRDFGIAIAIVNRDGFTPGHSTPQSTPVQGVEWIC